MSKKTINNYGNYAEKNNGVMNFGNENSEDNTKWYQEWWFISLMIGIFGAITFYVNFKLIGLSISIGIVLFLVSVFFNPNRRFYRSATGIMAIGVVSLVPSMMDYISKAFGLNIHANPWIGGLLICSATFLYYLDFKLNFKQK